MAHYFREPTQTSLKSSMIIQLLFFLGASEAFCPPSSLTIINPVII